MRYHFTEEQTEAQRGELFAHDPLPRKWQSWDLDTHGQAPESCVPDRYTTQIKLQIKRQPIYKNNIKSAAQTKRDVVDRR